MRAIELISESLYNIDNTKKILDEIMDDIITPFIEGNSRKGVYDVSSYFNLKGSKIQRVQLELTNSSHEFADCASNLDKTEVRVQIHRSKNKGVYYRTLKHEIVHVFDFIRSDGKHHKLGYKDFNDKFFIDIEFNEKINEIAMAIGKNRKIKYNNKEKILELVNKVSKPFAEALKVNSELYTKFLKRMIREKLMVVNQG